MIQGVDRMQYTKVLNVTPVEFFDAIQESIIDDVKQATNKKIHKIESGFQYSKKFGKEKMNVKIEVFKRNCEYKARMKTSHMEAVTSYMVKECEDGKSEVTYTEESIGRKVNAFDSMRFKSATKKQLSKMESYILSKRDSKN